MISPVEMRRIVGEWRVRLQRIKDIVQPAAWHEPEWRQFSQALALLVREHGRSWIIDPNVYWDLRWKLQDGGELIAQVEHVPGEKTSLVVAQNGGFAEQVGSYTWLWAEFDLEGNFSRDPYWVDGTWKDALTTLLLPLDRQSDYFLAGRAATPDKLLLQEGARPNDGHYRIAFLGDREPEHAANGQEAEAAPVANGHGAVNGNGVAHGNGSAHGNGAVHVNDAINGHGHGGTTPVEEIEFCEIPPLARTDYQNEVPRYACRAAKARTSPASFLYR